MGADVFDELMGFADPAMIVATTAAEGRPAGCLVGFHSQAGIDPERYCLWLSKANHTYRTALRASHFAIHLLTDADLSVAEWFGTRSGESTDKFAGLDQTAGPGGVPLLQGCPHRIVVERLAILDDGSDHVCVTTRVLSAHSPGEFTPLRLSDVEHLDPGRSTEFRSLHP